MNNKNGHGVAAQQLKVATDLRTMRAAFHLFIFIYLYDLFILCF